METAVSTTDDEHIENEEHRRIIADLFKQHNDTLIQFLRARLHSESDAHEVAQEAYVKLLDLDKPDAIGYLKAYLFRIASNLAIDRLRSKQRRPADSTPLVFFDTGYPSEEHAALKQEQLKLITLFINELPPKCRKVFLLSRIHGLSTMEIADLMRISDRMVRKYIVRATEYCRERLDSKLEGRL